MGTGSGVRPGVRRNLGQYVQHCVQHPIRRLAGGLLDVGEEQAERRGAGGVQEALALLLAEERDRGECREAGGWDVDGRTSTNMVDDDFRKYFQRV